MLLLAQGSMTRYYHSLDGISSVVWALWHGSAMNVSVVGLLGCGWKGMLGPLRHLKASKVTKTATLGYLIINARILTAGNN